MPWLKFRGPSHRDSFYFININTNLKLGVKKVLVLDKIIVYSTAHRL